MSSNLNDFSSLISKSCTNIGIKSLDNDIISYLNQEIEQKLNAIATQAKILMRITKRQKLTVDDISNSIRRFNQKENVIYPSFECESNEIDIDSFSSEPLAPCPLKPITHFHWFCLQGKIPNISSNKIQNEYVMPLNSINNNEYIQQGNSKVVPKLDKTLSKELVNFMENFENNFQKEIKKNLLSEATYATISNEMEINLIIIQSEPGIIHLFPYLLSYILNEGENIKNINEPKTQMIILYHIKAILTNKYFYVDPYLSQIIRVLLNYILYESIGIRTLKIPAMIRVKNLSLQCLKIINDLFASRYPSLTKDIVYMLSSNIIPNIKNPKYLTSYGAIRGLNILGISYVKQFIFPNMEKIISTLDMKEVLDAQDKKIKQKIDQNVANNQNLNVPINNTNDNENNISNSGNSNNALGGNIRMSFTLPITAGIDPMVYASLFATGQSQLNCQINNSAITNTINNTINTINNTNIHVNEKEENEMVIDDKAIDKVWCGINNNSTFVYYALVESAIGLYEQYSNDKTISNKILEIYGEDLVTHLKQDNIELDFII